MDLDIRRAGRLIPHYAFAILIHVVTGLDVFVVVTPEIGALPKEAVGKVSGAFKLFLGNYALHTHNIQRVFFLDY